MTTAHLLPRKRLYTLNDGVASGWHRLMWRRSYKRPAVVEAWLIPEHKNDPRIFVVLQENGDGAKDALIFLSNPIKAIELHITAVQSWEDEAELTIESLSRLDRLLLYAHKFLAFKNEHGLWNALKLAVAKLQQLRNGGNFGIDSEDDQPVEDKAYQQWLLIHESDDFALNASMLIKNHNPESQYKIIAFLRDGIGTSAVPHCDGAVIETIHLPPHHTAEFCRTALAESRADAFLIVPEHGQFRAGALEAMLHTLLTQPCAAVYTDHDLLNDDGERHTSHFKPGWSPIRLQECDYIGKSALFKPEALAQLSESMPVRTYALMKALAHAGTEVSHLPLIGFHSQGALPAPSHHTPAPPTQAKIEIIIPTRDNIRCLKPCIESILQHSQGRNFHITIINNNSSKPETASLFKRLQKHSEITILDDPSEFNFARLNNNARRHVKADVLVFLNDDTEVLTPNWLDELAHLALMPNVGCVGAMLLYPNGSIQHAGIAMGIRGTCGHMFRHAMPDMQTPLHDLHTRREVAAVTGACLAISAENFDAAHGFKPSYAVEYNDIDLCLRLNSMGKQTIWTPHVRVTHYESISRGLARTPKGLQSHKSSRIQFLQDWQEQIDADPFYNPNFTRAGEHYGFRV